MFQSAIMCNDIEDTKYVTVSLVLPSTYMLIQKARNKDVNCPWDEQTMITAPEMTPEVHATCQQVKTALEEKFFHYLPAFVVFIGLPFCLTLSLRNSAS